MSKNYTVFKLPIYYIAVIDHITIHPNQVLNVFNGTYKDTNLVFVNDGFTKKYIYFRLNIVLQISPKIILKPISLRQIKDPNLIKQIKMAREYTLLKYG